MPHRTRTDMFRGWRDPRGQLGVAAATDDRPSGPGPPLERLRPVSVEELTGRPVLGSEWPNGPMKVLRNRVGGEWEGRDDRTPQPPQPPQVIGQTLLGQPPY